MAERPKSGEAETPNLYEQTLDRWGLFGSEPVDAVTFARRFSSSVGSPITEQIVKVFESVPNIFPENWEAPLGRVLTASRMGKLTDEQKKVLLELEEIGRKQSPRWIELVIKCGVAFRESSAELPRIQLPY